MQLRGGSQARSHCGTAHAVHSLTVPPKASSAAPLPLPRSLVSGSSFPNTSRSLDGVGVCDSDAIACRHDALQLTNILSHNGQQMNKPEVGVSHSGPRLPRLLSRSVRNPYAVHLSQLERTQGMEESEQVQELARQAKEAFDSHRYESCLSTLNKLMEIRRHDKRAAHNRAVARYLLSNLTLTDEFRRNLQALKAQVGREEGEWEGWEEE